MRGLDYSAGVIPSAAIQAAGYRFVIRYVDNPHLSHTAKHIDPAEYAALRAAGITVYLVFEVDTDDMLGGFVDGLAHAHRAGAGADWIGYPGDQVIFFACDRHVTPAQVSAALAYLDGVATVLGAHRVGVYGFPELITVCIARGVGAAYWQCGTAPDTGGPVHLWQRNTATVHVAGIECDVNELLRPIPGPDAQRHTPAEGTTVMALTPEQDAKLTALYQYVSGSATVIPDGHPWPGWATWPGGSNQHLTATDYLRQTNVDLTTLKTQVAGLRATLDGFSTAPDGSFGALSDADIHRITEAVLVALAHKLTT